MTIKNPDGSIFQLPKPNPLLKTQDFTDDVRAVHNFQAEEVTVKYKRKKLVQAVGAVIGVADLPPLSTEQQAIPDPTIPPDPALLPKVPVQDVHAEVIEERKKMITYPRMIQFLITLSRAGACQGNSKKHLILYMARPEAV